MASSTLLTLLDDIASVLDDVAVLSKVAAKKTSGVLGDDLALNAEQVSGVKAEREFPVIWAVAKGSFYNKLILVPSALIISYFVPWLINVLLVIGGLYLCFEGAEKLFHKFFSSDHENTQEDLSKVDTPEKISAIEKEKINGAIKTDFVLSAEIIVIILGTVQTAAFSTQITVLSLLAIAFTVGVYGFVALIVKLDDMGLWLLKKSVSGSYNKLQRSAGRALLIFAPALMHVLSFVGTIAMFLVGGGIILHSIPVLHHVQVDLLNALPENWLIQSSMELVGVFVLGVIIGLLCLALLNLGKRFTRK
ncbi:DUF808 domain-containing protein [Agaribacter flavus]|uniref:DUF808 domain-containing protein n=1 Tax=Agaribacter flavus TaxID=1902781 RepID=A0ABV7FT75_9ALTE